MSIEDRLVDIEIKLSAQEDLTESLNRVVYEQQKKIDQLESLCAALARQLREAREVSAPGSGNEKPPHY